MSDNPTLWKLSAYDCAGAATWTAATRADLLAALGLEWYCVYGDEECVPEPHDGCHWAVHVEPADE